MARDREVKAGERRREKGERKHNEGNGTKHTTSQKETNGLSSESESQERFQGENEGMNGSSVLSVWVWSGLVCL